MTETVVGKSKISKSYQIAVIREIRPFLKVKPGDSLEWILKNGDIIVRKAA